MGGFFRLIGTVPDPVSANKAQIEITRPRVFTGSAALVIYAYGILLAIPVFASILLVSLVRFGTPTFLIPLLALVATAFIIPFGLGNAYVAKLVRSQNPAAAGSQEGFVVQLTLSPRIRSGIRALLEDADDIGWLTFTGSELVFQGDSVKLSVPFGQIKQVRPQNIGLRGLFVYGSRITILVSGLPNVTSLEFAERSSWLLPASRKTTRKLSERLNSSIRP